MSSNRPHLRGRAVRISVLATALALAPTGAWSAAKDFKEALATAVLNNPEVKLRYHTYQATAQDERAAEAGFYPRVDLSGFAGRDRQTTPSTSSDDFNRYGATLQLTQLLFDGFATRDEARRAGHAKLTRYYELLTVSDETALEAARAYIDVLRYRRFSELARDNYVIHRDLNAQIAERVKAGVGRKVDLEQASGRLALAESNWLTEESNLHDVSARYRRIVGETPDPNLKPVPDLNKFMPADRAFLPASLRGNPSFMAAVAAVRSARADAGVRKSTQWPSLSLRAAHTEEQNQNGVDGRFSNSSVQVVLNYNLYRGGGDTARIQQFANQLNATYDLRDKSCRDIQQTTQIAWNDQLRLKDSLDLLSQYELSTSKARDAYRQQFDIGARTLLDLLDTENELFNARRSVAGAEFDLQLAAVRVLAATSRLLPSQNLRPLLDTAPGEIAGGDSGDDALLCQPAIVPNVVLDKAALPPVSTAQIPAASAAAPVKPAEAKPSTAPTTGGDPMDALRNALAAWAQAWRSQAVADYLAAYSDDFKPAGNLSRADWAQQRRARITAASNPSLEIDKLQIARLDESRVALRFVQKYSSSSFSDVVNKSMVWARIGNEWRIQREESAAVAKP